MCHALALYDLNALFDLNLSSKIGNLLQNSHTAAKWYAQILFYVFPTPETSLFWLHCRAEVCRHTRADVCASRLYAPRGSPIAGTEHGEERVGQGAEYQLGEAVARGVPLPHRKWLQHAGATQLGQEPLHGGFTCGGSQGWREGRFLPERR